MSKQDDIEAVAKAAYVKQMDECSAVTMEQLYLLGFFAGGLHALSQTTEAIQVVTTMERAEK